MTLLFLHRAKEALCQRRSSTQSCLRCAPFQARVRLHWRLASRYKFTTKLLLSALFAPRSSAIFSQLAALVESPGRGIQAVGLDHIFHLRLIRQLCRLDRQCNRLGPRHHQVQCHRLLGLISDVFTVARSFRHSLACETRRVAIHAPIRTLLCWRGCRTSPRPNSVRSLRGVDLSHPISDNPGLYTRPWLYTILCRPGSTSSRILVCLNRVSPVQVPALFAKRIKSGLQAPMRPSAREPAPKPSRLIPA